jgi:hypothetical protein
MYESRRNGREKKEEEKGKPQFGTSNSKQIIQQANFKSCKYWISHKALERNFAIPAKTEKKKKREKEEKVSNKLPAAPRDQKQAIFKQARVSMAGSI